VCATAVEVDGKILIGGFFDSVNGVARNGVARLNADGSLDNTFEAYCADSTSLFIQGDGKILIGGYFDSVNGVTRNRLARLNLDGSLDTGFDPGASGEVECFVAQTDDRILVGGGYTLLGGEARNYIGRLNGDGALDISFDPGADNRVRCMALQADGAIIVGGDFTMLGGQPRFYIGRLVMYDSPAIPVTVQSQTAEIGASVDFAAHITGYPPPTFQWFCDGNAMTGCTNCILCLSGVQTTNVGVYSVVVSNIFGAVISSPAMLNVIAAVERRPVPGVKLTGESGSLLNVDYASSISPAPDWIALGSVSLTSTSQFCPDLTVQLPPTRFYRAWQTGTPAVVPSLNLNFVPAITLTGNINDSLRVDYINAIGPTDAWVPLDTVTLTNTSQLYFDVSAPGQPTRLYRIVPNP
jgi:uncharacterized delta-60 repeat protein